MSRPAHTTLATFAAVGCLLHAARASAQTVVYQPPPAELVTEPTERRGELLRGDVRYTDANADRVILGSTAETQPQGTFFISDYELLFLQLGYAITDDFQLSLSGIAPVVKGQAYYFDLGGKLNLVRGRVFRLALTGAVDMVTTGTSSGTSASTGPFWGGRVGAVGQFCLADTCRSSLSLGAGTVITSGASEVLPVYATAGLVVNLSSVVSLMVEPAMAGVVGTGTGSVASGTVFAVDYGVRLGGKNFAVDFTFIEPVASSSGSVSNPFVIGLPFVTFTYRTDGARR